MATKWLKACGTTSCIEVSVDSLEDVIGIRIKNPDYTSPVITATREEWETFKKDVKEGTFDGV